MILERHSLAIFGDHYQTGEEIGSGKFATVKRCISLQNGDEYAGKFIRKSRSVRFGQKIEDIELEIEILSELKHDNIIQLIDVYEDKNQVILVFELMKGGELQDYISDCNNRLTEHEAREFLYQILSSVAYMHQKSIVHLDLKPENILLCDEETQRIKIIDFGISRRFHERADIKGIYGTPEFTAPEILNYEPIGYGTDLWAIGCITYTMLYGTSPFLGDSKHETYANITRANYEFLGASDAGGPDTSDEISSEARNFISRLLVKDIRKRMSAVECLQHPWMQISKIPATVTPSIVKKTNNTLEDNFNFYDDEVDHLDHHSESDESISEEDITIQSIRDELNLEFCNNSNFAKISKKITNKVVQQKWKRSIRLVMLYNRHQKRKNFKQKKFYSCNSLTTDGGIFDEQDESFLLAALFGAIEEGNLHSIQELFCASNIDPNQCNKHGESLLHYCAGMGQLEIFKFLCKIGADLGVIDDQGDTVVHWAARQNHHHLIRHIYEQTTSIEMINKNLETPLHVAARYGHVETIEQLCKCGANINAIDEHGETAILIAVWHGFPKIVHILGEIGADTNIRNKEDETALHVASARGHFECVRCLLDAGANANLRNKNSYTPLHLALKRQHTAVAMLLLKAGADYELPDDCGERAVHYVARYNLITVCQWLCSGNAGSGIKPVLAACVQPNQNGCNVNIPNSQGLYPLHIAAKNGHIEIVRTLCLAGSIVDPKDRDLIVPQICAIAQSHNDIADLLTRLRNEQQKEEFIAQLIATNQPLTRVKLKVFGHSGSGKSTLIESMKCGYFSSWFRRSKVASSSSIPRGRSHKASHSADSTKSFAANGHSALKAGEANGNSLDSFGSLMNGGGGGGCDGSATKGIDCQQVYISGIGDLSVWEFGGHPNYYQIYDHFINATTESVSSCLHAIVFRLSDPASIQLQSIVYWLRFLQSRLPITEPLMYCGKSLQHAKIILIATHADLIPTSCDPDDDLSNLEPTLTSQNIANHLGELRQKIVDQFQHVFDIYENIFMMDASVAGSIGMKQLKQHLTTAKQSIVQQLPYSTRFLESVLTFLNLYRKASVNFPVLALHQFKEMIRSQINPLASDDHFIELIQQLEIMGEIFFLRAPAGTIPGAGVAGSNYDLIILNPKWLNCDIVGKLLTWIERRNLSAAVETILPIRRFTPAQLMGMYSIDEFQEEFPDVDALDLLQMLESLLICVQNDRSGDIEYEFPCFSLCGDLELVLDQFQYQENFLYHGVGFRCLDSSESSLNTSFSSILLSIFPRIQVALRSELGKHPTYDSYDLHNCFKFSHFTVDHLMTLVMVNPRFGSIEIRVCGPGEHRRDCWQFMQEILSIVERTIAMTLPGLAIEKYYLSPQQLKSSRESEIVIRYTSGQLMKSMLRVGLGSSLKRKSWNVLNYKVEPTTTSTNNNNNNNINNNNQENVAENFQENYDDQDENDELETIADILCFGITDLSEINIATTSTPDHSVGSSGIDSNSNSNGGRGGGGQSSTNSGTIPPGNTAGNTTNNRSVGNSSSTINQSSNSLGGGGEPTLANELHSSNLSLLTRKKLCALLDPPESIGRDWCMFGILLGMTDKLPKLDPGLGPLPLSPTARVLEECVRNANCTVRMLVEKLSELNRFDAVEVILQTGPLLRIFPSSSLPEEGVVFNDESSHTSLGVSTLSHTSSSNLSR